MIQIKRVSAKHADFIKLVALLNADLASRDGENHPLTHFKEIASIQNVLVA